jgi:1,4-dihydroxy-2-naphthoate octaprenyltransferase
MSQKTFSSFILAARPKTLLLSVSPICLGSAFAPKVDPALFALMLLFALFIQIGTNLANDYFDFLKGADTHERKGPPRAMQMGLLTKKQMKAGIWFVFSFAFLCSLIPMLKVGPLLALLPILSILFGLLYTAGPYPIGYLGLGDLFVLLFFGPLATFGAHYVQTLTFSWNPIIAGFGPGLLSIAVLTVANLRDVDQDRKVNKKTLQVRLGKKFAKWEYFVCLLGAFFIPIYLWAVNHYSPLLLASSLSLTLLIHSGKIVLFYEEKLNLALAKTALSILPYTLLFALGVL